MYQTVFELPDQCILDRIIYRDDGFFFFNQKWNYVEPSFIRRSVQQFYDQQIVEVLDLSNNNYQKIIALSDLRNHLGHGHYLNRIIEDIKLRCYRKDFSFNQDKTVIPTNDNRLVMTNGMTRPAFISDYILQTFNYRYNPNVPRSEKIESLFQGYRSEILGFLNMALIKHQIHFLQMIQRDGNTGITTLMRTIRTLRKDFTMINHGHHDSTGFNFNGSLIMENSTAVNYPVPSYIVKLQPIEKPIPDFDKTLTNDDYEYFLKIIIEHGLGNHREVSLCVILVLYCDGYLKPKHEVDLKTKRFFSIIKQLPFDILQAYCNRHFRSSKSTIPTGDFETDCQLICRFF